MKHALAFFGVLAGSLCQAQDLFGEEKRTFLLMPAEVISSGVVRNVDVASTGRHIIFQRTPIPSIEELTTKPSQASPIWYIYDRTTKTTTKLPVPEQAKQVSILGDGNTIFYSGFQPADPQGFVNLKTGARNATNVDVGELAYLGDKPFAPFLISVMADKSVNLIAPGRQPISIKLPDKVGLSSPTGVDAGHIYFNAYVRTSPMRFGRVTYTLETGGVAFAEMTRDEFMKQDELEVKRSAFWFENVGDLSYVKLADRKVVSSPQANTGSFDNNPSKSSASKSTSFIPTKAKLALANCNPVFSDKSDFVVYQDAGALLIRDIKPIDADLAKKMIEAALRTKAMNEAKQAALSLLMYGADMDDVLPGAEGWEDKVMPYSLDKDLLKNFNYTFRGGDVTNVQSPSTTELGFTMGPGGRAVAYLDGHVKWIPNP